MATVEERVKNIIVEQLGVDPEIGGVEGHVGARDGLVRRGATGKRKRERKGDMGRGEPHSAAMSSAPRRAAWAESSPISCEARAIGLVR